jgi:hypothetical protein
MLAQAEGNCPGDEPCPYPAIFAAAWLVVCDRFVPKQTMFAQEWLSVGDSQLKLGRLGSKSPCITRVSVARPEGLEPPTF